MKAITSLLLLLMSFSAFAVDEGANGDKISLFSTIPVDNSLNKEKNRGLLAFIDTYLRFRLEPLKGVEVISKETLIKSIPSLNSFTPCSDKTYLSYARANGCTYLLVPQFEVLKNKEMTLYIDLVSVQNGVSIFAYEKDFIIDSLAINLDTILLKVFSSKNIPLSSDDSQFFNKAYASCNYKSVKQLGDLLFESNSFQNTKTEKTFSVFETYIRKTPSMVFALQPFAINCVTNKQFEKAANYLNVFLDKVPNYSTLNKTLALAYRLSGKPANAVNLVQMLEKRDGESIDLLYEKARSLHDMKKFEDAAKTYHKILGIDSNYLEALIYVSANCNDQKEFSLSLTYSQKVLSLDSNNAHGYYEQGRSYLGLHQLEKAHSRLLKATALQPGNYIFKEGLGDALFDQGKYDEAGRLYLTVLQKSKLNLNVVLKIVKTYETTNKNADALNLLKANSVHHSTEPRFLRALGISEFKNNNYKAAISPLDLYTKIYTDDIDALLVLGKAYDKTGNYDRALQIYSQLGSIYKDQLELKLLKAEAYLHKSDTLNARELLKQVISQRQVKNAHALMGEVYLLSRNLKNAFISFSKERELHGDNPQIQEKIAKIQFERGLYSQSAQEFLKLLKLTPDHSSARYYLAIVQIKEQKFETAEKTLIDASRFGNGNQELCLTIANEFFLKKRYPESVEYYEKTIKFNPLSEEALLKCALANIRAGRDSLAAENYIRLFKTDSSKFSSYLAEAGHIFKKISKNKNAADAYSLFLSKGFIDFSVNCAYSEIEYEKGNYSRVSSLLKGLDYTKSKDKKLLLMLADSRCYLADYQNAIPALEAVIQIEKGNRTALQLVAKAYEKTNSIAKSIAAYEQLLKLPADENYASLAFHLGELYEKSNRPDYAIAQYESNRRMAPDDLRNHERLGVLYTKSSKWISAKEVLEAALEFPQASPMMKKMLAQTYSVSGEPENAISTYRTYLAENSTDASAWKELGKVFFAVEKYADAIYSFAYVNQLMSRDFEANVYLGRSYIETGNYKKAIVPLGHARSDRPHDISVIELYARCYRNLNETSSLITLLNEWIKEDPKRFDIRLELGSLYLNQKSIDKGIEVLTGASRFLPFEFRPHLLLAQAYELKGIDSLRLVHLEKAARCNPLSWELHFQYARYYLSKSKRESALKHLSRVIELKEDCAPAHFEAALILIEKDSFSNAIPHLVSALKFDSRNYQYKAAYAFALAMNGMDNKALSIVDSLNKSATSDPSVYYWIGQVYLKNMNKQAAFDNFTIAITLNPDYAKCYEIQGDILFERHKFKEAASKYLLAWEKGGYNPIRATKIGNVLSYNLQYKEAAGFYESIVTHKDHSGEALYRLINCYCEMNDIASARKYQKLFRKDDAPWIQLAQGILYEGDNNYESALVAYDIANRISISNPLVYSGYARIFAKQEKYDSSISYFARSLSDSLNMQNMMNFAGVHTLIGSTDSALYYYNYVKSRLPEHPSVFLSIAKIKSEKGDHESAISTLIQGLKYHPSDPIYHFQLGKEYEMTGKFETALEEYQVSLKIGKGTPVEALKHIGNIYYQNIINEKKAKEFFKRYVKAGGDRKEIQHAMSKLEGI